MKLKHPITGGPADDFLTALDGLFLQASRGYVVASIDHTYEATAVQFPAGRFLHSGFGSHLGKKLLEEDTALAFAMSVRLEDLRFVASELARLSQSVRGPFSGKLDTSRMAVAGHSMGGLAASLMVNRDPRFKAAVIVDVHNGDVPDAVLGATTTPGARAMDRQ